MTVDELSRIANRLRLDVVETVHDAGDGHPGPCMSMADILATLYFDEMKIDPANPNWPERDALYSPRATPAPYCTPPWRARATSRLRSSRACVPSAASCRATPT